MDQFLDVLGLGWTLVIFIPHLTDVPRYAPIPFCYGMAAFALFFTIWCTFFPEGIYTYLQGLIWGVNAVLWIYAIWKRRPPRKRKESKTLAKIRNLGHRLVTE